MNVKIIIMCGGRGRRLEPLTSSVPKPLVEIGGESILKHKIEFYKRQGFHDFIFCIGYKSEMIIDAVGDIDGIIAEFSDSGEDAGILERIYNVKEKIEGDAIVTYGDTFTDLNLNELLSRHKEHGSAVTIVTAPIVNPFGLVEIAEDSSITSFKEKPVLNYYIGYHVISRGAFDFIPKFVVEKPDGEGLVMFFKMLIGMGYLGSFEHSGTQITFNTMEEHKIAEEKIKHFFTLN
jgi:NDP-sugar pyrophosphorylase family protein